MVPFIWDLVRGVLLIARQLKFYSHGIAEIPAPATLTLMDSPRTLTRSLRPGMSVRNVPKQGGGGLSSLARAAMCRRSSVVVRVLGRQEDRADELLKDRDSAPAEFGVYSSRRERGVDFQDQVDDAPH